MVEISTDELKKIDLRVGKVLEAKRVEGSEKLLALQIDLGNEKRQIVAGIAQFYKPDEIIGKNVVVVANLQKRKIFNLISEGMILAADNDEKISLITVDKDIKPGSKVR